MRYVVTFNSHITETKPLFLWLENNVEKIEIKRQFFGTAIVFATDRQIAIVRQHSSVMGVEEMGDFRATRE